MLVLDGPDEIANYLHDASLNLFHRLRSFPHASELRLPVAASPDGAADTCPVGWTVAPEILCSQGCPTVVSYAYSG